MVHQAKKIASNTPVDSVTVVADDTDIFALLLSYYHTLQITIPIFMTSPKKTLDPQLKDATVLLMTSCKFTQFQGVTQCNHTVV